jgi:hypothetical protein
MKRNGRTSTKNTPNPRTPKTPKSSPFSHRFGKGIKVKITTKGSCIYPPTNRREKGLQITPRNTPRKGSEKYQKRKAGRTQTSLDEPRRIIYTYHEGSYKV